VGGWLRGGVALPWPAETMTSQAVKGK